MTRSAWRKPDPHDTAPAARATAVASSGWQRLLPMQVGFTLGTPASVSPGICWIDSWMGPSGSDAPIVLVQSKGTKRFSGLGLRAKPLAARTSTRFCAQVILALAVASHDSCLVGRAAHLPDLTTTPGVGPPNFFLSCSKVNWPWLARNRSCWSRKSCRSASAWNKGYFGSGWLREMDGPRQAFLSPTVAWFRRFALVLGLKHTTLLRERNLRQIHCSSDNGPWSAGSHRWRFSGLIGALPCRACPPQLRSIPFEALQNKAERSNTRLNRQPTPLNPARQLTTQLPQRPATSPPSCNRPCHPNRDHAEDTTVQQPP
jgi:hypothetical protein